VSTCGNKESRKFAVAVAQLLQTFSASASTTLIFERKKILYCIAYPFATTQKRVSHFFDSIVAQFSSIEIAWLHAKQKKVYTKLSSRKKLQFQVSSCRRKTRTRITLTSTEKPTKRASQRFFHRTWAFFSDPKNLSEHEERKKLLWKKANKRGKISLCFAIKHFIACSKWAQEQAAQRGEANASRSRAELFSAPDFMGIL
jgi:hypothetical protein